ncbi:hypothetical protein TruAng_010570 [Truncatella angustata]|nr:hypothetical protein TruAng_010570 [Truncatella angustata]
MFITFKNAGKEKPQQGMEQVASRNAGPGGDRGSSRRVRPTFRPPCLACQSKKACIFPVRRSSERSSDPPSNDLQSPTSRGTPGSVSSASSRAERTNRLAHGPDGLVDNNPHHAPDPEVEDMPDATEMPQDTADYARDHSDFAQYGPQYLANGTMTAMATTQNIFATDLATMPPLDLHKSHDALASAATTRAQPSTALDWALEQRGGEEPPSGLDNTMEQMHVSKCSCLQSLIQIVQQLDDDHYRITTLSLDQVLQLQKGLVAQCDKPFACLACDDVPAIYTFLVIICDRLTEMFECIHKRIKRMNQRLTNDDSPGSFSGTNSSSEAGESISGQLFCSTTGEMATRASCNPALFSPHFQDSFSNEEQLHMVGALLKLQMGSFQSLLARVRNSASAAGSQARQSRVDFLKQRLGRAAGNISEELRRTAQMLSVS